MRTLMTAGLVLAVAGVASAQTWGEMGDAGQDGIGAAQTTVGSGSLSSITGLLTSGADVDLYEIRITDIAGFTASTIGGASFDTQLFLFAADGSGITENDDSGGLQSLINSDGLIGSGSGVGNYFLAVSRFNADPRDAGGVALFGFGTWPGSGDQRMPTSTAALAQWTTSGSAAGDYRIELTGAEYAVPAPASLALLGLGGLAAARRRR